MEEIILSAIGSTEPSTFNEFCRELKDCPAKGDREGWRQIFSALDSLERTGFVEVERNGRSIESLILTQAGADRIRAKMDERRGLFRDLKSQ